jgi:uncharacterized membrane protein YcaP (DUF421 family)
MGDLFNLSVPWWQFVLRCVAVYFFLMIMLRLTGKKQVGQLSSFDLILLLVLSNAVQNSMNAGDNSLLGGLIAATTLIGLNYLVSYLTYRFKKIDVFVEGRPQILIHNGKLDEKVMVSAHLTLHEIHEALRAEGCLSLESVAWAILEVNGKISVIPRRDMSENAEAKS